MKYNKFDDEYYVMNVDGADNHPMLAWGSVDYDPFLEAEPIEEGALELPMQIVFDEPYPKQYEMPDFLMLSGQFAASEKFKSFFEERNVHGIQFFPVEITDNKKRLITGHYAIHVWNQLPAIDKDNYEGDPVDRFGSIMSLERFSLDAEQLNDIPAEERAVFMLEEDSSMFIVHRSLVEAMQAAGLTGMRFWKVSEWDEDAMFR